MTRKLHWYDFITVNIYFLGLTTLSQTNGLVFPLLVQRFVGETQQGNYYGQLRLWTLMVALLWQALVGLLSDHSSFRWGRRRPFIFIGTVLNIVLITIVGYATGMSALSGFWFLFTVAIFQSMASNTAQAAQQGLIPDLVPAGQRGRFSGVKALFEAPVPLILVSFTIAPMISRGNYWGALFLATGILVFAMLLTMLAPEKPQKEKAPLDWTPFIRLLVMTGVFTTIILGSGWVVRTLGRLLAEEDSLAMLVAIMGSVGLAAMLVAIVLGVRLSVQVGLGDRAARQNRSFAWWVVNRLAFLVGAFNLSTFAVYFLQARLGLVREQAATPASRLILIVGVCILLSTLPGGWLADRFGRKTIVAASGLLGAAGVLIALLSPSLPIIFVGGALIGIATGLFFTANWALGTELVPKAEAGRYLGISNLAGAGAGAVGAYIGGPVADFFTARFPDFQGLGYVILFALYGLLFLVSVAALSQVHEPAPGAQELAQAHASPASE